MPGVPSGRGCNACRKQKKKCDQAKPKCARCTRLDLHCIGSGQRRYVFKAYDEPEINDTERRIIKTDIGSCQRRRTSIEILVTVPINSQGRLIEQYGRTIASTTDIRFNLLWHYGGYLADIPQRIGLNEALDASVEALTSAHLDVCARGAVISTHTLSLYSQALRTLRICLNNPVKACEVETLCAVTLLLNCEGFLGLEGTARTGHGEGAAQILKVRGYYDPKDKFEAKLLLALRGPVLFEGVFNSNIHFTPLEWKILVENTLDTDSFEGKILRCLAKVPEFMRRSQSLLSQDDIDNLYNDIHEQYATSKEFVARISAALQTLPKPAIDDMGMTSQAASIYGLTLRGYGLGLYVAIVFNCMLSALMGANNEFTDDSRSFSKEILFIARNSHGYRPLSSALVVLCIAAGLAVAVDFETRSELCSQLTDFKQDLPWGHQIVVKGLDNKPNCTGFNELKTLQERFGKLLTESDTVRDQD